VGGKTVFRQTAAAVDLVFKPRNVLL